MGTDVSALMEVEADDSVVIKRVFGRVLEKMSNKIPTNSLVIRTRTHVGVLTTTSRCHGTVL